MQKIDKILIGVAFSPNLKPNIFEAVRLANMFDAELVGVHVGKKTDKKITDLNALLEEADSLNKNFKVIWQEGKPVDVILQTSSNENIDLLILGALQRENLFKYYVGSIARKITRKAPCSVLLLIKPSVERVSCKHIVVNGLSDNRTEETIKTSFFITKKLNCKKITIVEEIKQEELHVKVNDDISLRRATIAKERIKTREDRRVKSILKDIDCSNLSVKTQSIFGKRGYSIGHYAKLKRADLLVMNAPSKLSVLDRIFPHDIEYILSELPTDVLIVK
ncbi:Nucleotide-binding universal stress protein, UspA family [Polaribacter sp. Hel1_33_78]|uniref:universal stress protein n=1 Tax=unclassified Polaribacter TaxID=196858 RepID=UPI00052B9D6A|nr:MULTISPECIES: universal stress protein [unclassified Polaribacter]KGL60821.1 UspA domain protein-containing protein [Polaribacter sp. Hel1_33_49]MBT3740678.1 universal stress protein [Polaribacter sp.]MBT7815389.1 universal stress protein [Polaribacter sp.]MDG1195916.1 universal stress protein [Polaribacter sp.]MDG1403263.1 universal stress protein [Polaribacter sp.]